MSFDRKKYIDRISATTHKSYATPLRCPVHLETPTVDLNEEENYPVAEQLRLLEMHSNRSDGYDSNENESCSSSVLSGVGSPAAPSHDYSYNEFIIVRKHKVLHAYIHT